MAEYREIFMIGSSLQRSLKSKNWDPSRIPKEFKLGEGHVLFFYDKGKYLYNRYEEIRNELLKRNFKLNKDRLFKTTQFPTEYYNDWKPTEQDQAIVWKRIEERIKLKPEWYRHLSLIHISEHTRPY